MLPAPQVCLACLPMTDTKINSVAAPRTHADAWKHRSSPKFRRPVATLRRCLKLLNPFVLPKQLFKPLRPGHSREVPRGSLPEGSLDSILGRAITWLFTHPGLPHCAMQAAFSSWRTLTASWICSSQLNSSRMRLHLQQKGMSTLCMSSRLTFRIHARCRCPSRNLPRFAARWVYHPSNQLSLWHDLLLLRPRPLPGPLVLASIEHATRAGCTQAMPRARIVAPPPPNRSLPPPRVPRYPSLPA